VTGDWRKLRNYDLSDLYFRTNIIRIRRIIWARDVVRMGKERNVNRISCRNIKERDHLEDLGINGRIRLKLLLKRPVNALTGFIWLRIETNVRLLCRRHSNA